MARFDAPVPLIHDAKAIADDLGTPLVIHQPSYSLVNRWIEDGLTEALTDSGMGAIAFTALAQGLLSNRYTSRATDAQRSTKRPSFDDRVITPDLVARLDGLAAIAERRGQTLAQLALVWVLRDPVVSSTLVGASSVEQLAENLAALENPEFSDDELAEIDGFAVEAGIDNWRSVAEL